MANKEKIDFLLLDIRKLETLVASMRDAEIYPVSFFGQTFDLTHKILTDLHTLETNQIELLRKQMEEHQTLLQSTPSSVSVSPQTKQETYTIEPDPVLEEEKNTSTIKEIETAQTVENLSQEQDSPQLSKEPILEAVEEVNKAVTPERTGLFLSDILEKKHLSDFRKAFSLNDRFRFRRELFGGDEERMNKAIHALNEIQSYEDSITYLNNELKWNVEDEAVADFIKLLEKRFL